jgi:hypothetical protein
LFCLRVLLLNQPLDAPGATVALAFPLILSTLLFVLFGVAMRFHSGSSGFSCDGKRSTFRVWASRSWTPGSKGSEAHGLGDWTQPGAQPFIFTAEGTGGGTRLEASHRGSHP